MPNDNESTIMEKLAYLEGTKTSIKNAIIAKGQEIDDNTTFREYASKIAAIETGGDTSDATASQGDILTGYTAYIASGKVEGTMANNGPLNFTPSTSSQTIPVGYTSGGTIAAVTSDIDSNIKAENIKKDVTILGITGTLTASEDLNQELTAQTQKIQELEAIIESKAASPNKVEIYSTVQEMQAASAQEGDKALIYTEDTSVNPNIFNFIGFYRYNGNDWIKLSPDISTTELDQAVNQAQDILN